MAIRGESVGTAYVRILADGSGLDRSIREKFRESEPVIRASGEHHGEVYEEAFDKGFKRSSKKSDIYSTLKEQIGKMEGLAEGMGDNFQEELTDAFTDALSDGRNEENARELGERMASNWMKGFNDSGDLTINLRRTLAQATKDIERDRVAALERERKLIRALELVAYNDTVRTNKVKEEALERERRLIQKIEADRATALERNATRINRIGDKVGRIFGKGSRNDFLNLFGGFIGVVTTVAAKVPEVLAGAATAVWGYIGDLGKAFKTGEGFLEGFGNVASKMGTDLLGVLKSIPPEVWVAVAAIGALVAPAIVGAIGAAAAGISGLAAAFVALGAALSMGLVGALSSLVALLPTLGVIGLTIALPVSQVKKSSKEITKLEDKYKSLKKELGLLDKTTTKTTTNQKTVTTHAKSQASAVATYENQMKAYQKVMDSWAPGSRPWINASEQRAAAAKNLAEAEKGHSTEIEKNVKVTGKATTANEAYIKKRKELAQVEKELREARKKDTGKIAEEFKNFGELFKNLGLETAPVLFADLPAQLKKLKPVVTQGLGGLVGAAAPALNTVGKDIIAEISKGFTGGEAGAVKKFMDALEKNIPTQVKNLGLAVKGGINGIAGIFTAAQPTVNRFTEDLGKGAAKFDEWVNSAEGQNSLEKFFNDAYDAAVNLKNLLWEVGAVIGTVILQANPTGQSIIKDTTKDLQGLVTWLNSAEGRARMTEWLEFGKKLWDSLSTATGALVEFFDFLDNDETRALVLWLVDQLPKAFLLMKMAVTPVLFPLTLLVNGIGLVRTTIENLGFIWNTIWTGIKVAALRVISIIFSGFRLLINGVMSTLSGFLRFTGAMLSSLGIGFGKTMTQAADKVDGAQQDMNASLDKIQTDIEISIETAEAENQAYQLQKRLQEIRSKTIQMHVEVVITGNIETVTLANGRRVRLPSENHAKGTGNAPGGLSMVGELGPELVQLPPGSKVLRADRTAALVNKLRASQPRAYATGSPQQGFVEASMMRAISGSGGITPSGRTVTVNELTIVTPAKDPVAVARETINHMAAATYLA